MNQLLLWFFTSCFKRVPSTYSVEEKMACLFKILKSFQTGLWYNSWLQWENNTYLLVLDISTISSYKKIKNKKKQFSCFCIALKGSWIGITVGKIGFKLKMIFPPTVSQMDWPQTCHPQEASRSTTGKWIILSNHFETQKSARLKYLNNRGQGKRFKLPDCFPVYILKYAVQ